MLRNSRLDMVDFDQVKERACIAFITSKGQPTSVWINKPTFKLLMEGPWDNVKLGEPHLYQRELRDAMKSYVKKNYMPWFEHEANILMKKNAGKRKSVNALEEELG